MRRSVTAVLSCALLAVIPSGCAEQPQVDLAATLKGVEMSTFLGCSGPPLLEYPEAGQDRMSFVTNLKRGDAIGIAGPTVSAPDACSVDAVFQDHRLVSSRFSGNPAMCNWVFSPCLPKK